MLMSFTTILTFAIFFKAVLVSQRLLDFEVTFLRVMLRQLQKGGTFRTCRLIKGMTSTKIVDKKIDNLYYNWFDTLNDVQENSYNRPRSRIFETTDSIF